MIFKIINPDKLEVMRTEHWKCVPPREILEDMTKYGYKFLLDGKRISGREIEKLRE